jgi:predicted enzyme related to lactoylglutathione lyase
VLLRVENLETAVAYYQEAFGLRLQWRNAGPVGLGLPETDAEIVLESEADLPAGASVHCLVGDVSATVDYLATRGCSVVVAPFEITIGHCAVVTDPFGNTLGLLDMTKGPLPQGSDSPLSRRPRRTRRTRTAEPRRRNRQEPRLPTSAVTCFGSLYRDQ